MESTCDAASDDMESTAAVAQLVATGAVESARKYACAMDAGAEKPPRTCSARAGATASRGRGDFSAAAENPSRHRIVSRIVAPRVIVRACTSQILATCSSVIRSAAEALSALDESGLDVRS